VHIVTIGKSGANAATGIGIGGAVGATGWLLGEKALGALAAGTLASGGVVGIVAGAAAGAIAGYLLAEWLLSAESVFEWRLKICCCCDRNNRWHPFVPTWSNRGKHDQQPGGVKILHQYRYDELYCKGTLKTPRFCGESVTSGIPSEIWVHGRPRETTGERREDDWNNINK
jgi:hypothetical protein